MPRTGQELPMGADALIICATPRSGSTLLCDLLAGSGVAGRPNSFYRRESIPHFADAFGVARTDGIDGRAFDRAYFDALLRAGRGGTGVFAMRLMWPSVAEASVRLDRLFPGLPGDAARFERAFGRPLYLFLERGDKVAQAVSRLKAEQSGLWHRHADGSERERSVAQRAPQYDRERLGHFLAETLDHEASWRQWFAAEGIAPMPLRYESLSADPRGVLAEVLAALGQDPSRASRVPLKTSKMADAESVAWALRYREEQRIETRGESHI
jgi:trehalose 2-sulfotransferase